MRYGKGGMMGSGGGVENGQVNASQPIVPIKLSYTGSFRSPQLGISRIVIYSTTSICRRDCILWSNQYSCPLPFILIVSAYWAPTRRTTPYAPSNRVYVNKTKIRQVIQLTLRRNIFVLQWMADSANNLLKFDEFEVPTLIQNIISTPALI